MENPKVLAEFVEEELSEDHVKLIGEMIRPEEIIDQDTHPNYKRLFLYEVCTSILLNFIMCTNSNSIIGRLLQIRAPALTLINGITMPGIAII